MSMLESRPGSKSKKLYSYKSNEIPFTRVILQAGTYSVGYNRNGMRVPDYKLAFVKVALNRSCKDCTSRPAAIGPGSINISSSIDASR